MQTIQSTPTTATVIEPKNGFGIAALICGITGFVAGWIPLFFFVAGTLGLVALVLGLVGRGKVKRGSATNGKVTTWGWITGIAALIMATIGMVICFNTVNNVDKDLNKIGDNLNKYTECVNKLDVNSPTYLQDIDKCDAQTNN